MKKYKLIKKLPFEFSPEIGYISEPKITTSEPSHYLNHNWFDPEKYPEFWEKVIEKDYEILSISLHRSDKPKITNMIGCSEDYILSLLNCDGNKIHSVKRLSDNEIFTIGDKTKNGIIKSIFIPFEFGTTTVCIQCDNKKGIYLKNITKTKTPLFTTEDGVDIFEGDKIYSINRAKFIFKDIDRIIQSQYFERSSVYKYFSTKEKAEEFILLNKPCLSLKEIKETTTIKGLSLKKLERFVQEKIKNN